MGKEKNGGSHQRKRNEGIILGGGFNLYGSEGPDWIPKTSEDERDTEIPSSEPMFKKKQEKT